MRHIYLLRLMLLISVVIGCKQQASNSSVPQPPAAKPVAESEEPESPVVADATEGDSADQPSASEPPAEDMATATDIPTENETTEPVGAEAVAEIATEAKPPSERFLLLTRDGPLVIDVVLQIDNEPYTNALAQLVERVFLDLKVPMRKQQLGRR